MNPQASDTTAVSEDIKPVTDKEQAVLFMTFRKPFDAIKSNGKTIFNFKMADIADLLFKWQHNEPIPVDDIRDVFDAQKAFNSTVRD